MRYAMLPVTDRGIVDTAPPRVNSICLLAAFVFSGAGWHFVVLKSAKHSQLWLRAATLIGVGQLLVWYHKHVGLQQLLTDGK